MIGFSLAKNNLENPNFDPQESVGLSETGQKSDITICFQSLVMVTPTMLEY